MKPLKWIAVLFSYVIGSAFVQAQETGTFTAAGNLIANHTNIRAALLASGKVLICGDDASPELFDPSTRMFASTGRMRNSHRGAVSLLPDGRVLIAAGKGDNPLTAELYDPSTETFSEAGSMTSTGQVATLLADGRLLLAGFPTAQIYDPASGIFTPTSGYAGTNPFLLHSATLLSNGTVLVIGTIVKPYPDGLAGWAELFDPITGTFSVTGAPVGGWFQGSAVGLLDGKVLFAGTYEGGSPIVAEVYDPVKRTFTSIGNKSGFYGFSSTALLPDGKVLLSGDGEATSEIYDPVTGTFATAAKTTTTRFSQTATLLSDGELLMAGGYAFTGSGPISSSELYPPAVPIHAPTLLSLSGDGKGQGAIQHAGSFRIASPGDPAVAGEYLSSYLVGLADGSVIPPQVSIGGRTAAISFFGNVPGYPGLDVVNVRMPPDVAPGDFVPVRLTYLGRPSNPVTIGAR
jgi:hypothetical protein